MTRIRHAGCVLIAVLIAITATSAQGDLTALLDQAEQLLKASRTAEAQPLFERARDTAKQAGRDTDLARAYLGIAVVALRGGRGAQALATAKEALAIYERAGDQRGVAVAAYQVAEWERQPADSRPYYERSIAAARVIADPSLEGQSLHRLGDDAFTAGRYEESLQHLTRAATAYEAATRGADPSEARADLGTVYNSLGRLYRAHGRMDEALKYQQAALALHRTSGNDFYLVQSLNAVAVVYERLDNLEAARAHWNEALKIAATLPESNTVSARARDFLRANMVGLLTELGEYATAASTLEEVIAAGRDVFPAERSAELSYLYRNLGRTKESLAAADRAVTLCNEPVTCIKAYNARADARAAAGEGAAALADLSVTLQRLEELRGRLLPSDFYKQGFAAHYQHYYGSAIARQLDEHLERASLETAERARSRAFLDLLASKAIAPPSAAVPGPALQGESGVASPATATAATADDLVRTAARLKSNLLLYWVGDTATVIWVVKPDGAISARRVPVTKARLTALVRATAPFKEAATAKARVLNDSVAAWRQLYTLLVAPVRAQLPAAPGTLLTIVRHDVLSNLSFAALQDARGRYLLEDFALHYAPTGGLFTFTAAQRRPDSRTGAMLMVADPDTAARSPLDAPLSRLPGARMEAAAITKQLAARQVLSLQGADATETAVRAEAGSRSILHFAAHAIVDDSDPFAAYLALGGSADASSDGRLTAQDVYGLNLSAELVVLSACKSANGLVAGDSVATFARAFTYAGAASLIASVWDVADEPSHQLLPAFYRAWLGGATKAAALRQAQLRVLSDLRGGRVKVTTALGPVAVPEHPVFWAGFVLFGEPD